MPGYNNTRKSVMNTFERANLVDFKINHGSDSADNGMCVIAIRAFPGGLDG